MDHDDWHAGPGPRMPTGPRAFPRSGVNSLASTGARAAARILDLLVVGLPTLMLTSAVIAAANGFDPQREATAASHVALMAPFVVVLVLYEAISVALWGQTFGKFVIGVRVARQVNGRCPVWWQAALRIGVLAVVLVVPHPLAVFVAATMLMTGSFDLLGRNLLDRAAGTVVVAAR